MTRKNQNTTLALPPHRGQVRLAIIGAGGMAANHARQFSKIRGCRLVSVCDVDVNRVNTFAETHGIPGRYTSLEEMLAAEQLDAVTIVTPDAFHAPLAIQCLQAGKHVLCEKPLALNHADATRMVKAARVAARIAMVNLSYRDWPALQAVAALVQAGKLGDLRHVEANYMQAWLVSRCWGDWRDKPGWLWRLSKAAGSNGVLGDVGVHIVDFATFPAGPIAKVYCQLKTFPKAPRNRMKGYVLDANDSAVINVVFRNGALGTLHTTRWCAGHANRLYLKLSGTLGTVEIDSDRATDAYRICSGEDLHTNTWREVKCKATPSNYERFIRAVRTGRSDQPDFATGADVQRVLDACLASAEKDNPVLCR